jgi:hypothetical protein
MKRSEDFARTMALQVHLLSQFWGGTLRHRLKSLGPILWEKVRRRDEFEASGVGRSASRVGGKGFGRSRLTPRKVENPA